MKKLLAILLVVCLIVTSVFSTSANAESTQYDLTTKTLTMPELAGKYKTQGRTVLKDDILLAHYPATGIEFNAYCSGDVSVTFNVIKLHSNDQAVLDEFGGCYFTVIIDGVRQARDTCKITSTGAVTLKIAEGLELGEHNFKIYRQNEITHANLGFKSITLSGELLEAPQNKDTYIEFVGASQWGGWGAIGDNTIDKTYSSMPLYQDVTQGLTYLTAEHLDTDWSIVSVGGMGAYWGGQTMNTVYDYVGYYNDKTTLYDFARQPDYVVIGLGTNDVSKAEENGKSEEDIYEAFDYFIRRMRFKNPNAKIVWVHGMMTTAVDKYVEKIVTDLGGAEYGVYNVKVTQNNDGASSHPSAEGHAVMAEELSAFIESIKDDTFKSELPKKAAIPDAQGEVIIESDFSSTTNWTKRTPAQVTFMDEDNDGVNDFARLTGSSTANVALRSTPGQVIPGNDYVISFYARIPKESKAFHTDTYKNYPLFIIYQPTLNSDGTQVTDNHSTGKNEYSYSYSNGTTLTRRTDLISTWQISGEFAPYNRKGYSMFDSTHDIACAHVSPDEVYKDWTKVTVKFTASASDDNDGAQTIALYFALNKNTNMADCMFDIKDVRMVNTSYVESEETEPGVVFSEGFETLSDVTTVIKNGTTSTWAKYEITDEDAATGNKSAKVFTPYNVSYIPLDKSKLVENSEYEFSINWKMLEYTETKARQLRYLRLAGWNPSEGDTVKNSSTNIGGIYTAINATGDWVNTSIKFTISDLDAYEEFIIKFDCASTPNTSGSSYTQAEDSIYIDDIKLVGEGKEPEEGKVLFESDFDGDTNWYANNTTRVGYLDDNGDGVTDYAQIHPTKDKASYLSSTPTTLIPGKEYQLTFYARVPEDSGAYTGEYIATDGTTATYSYAPVFSIYQPTVNSEGIKVTDIWVQGQNEYAYKNVRRTKFTVNFQIGDYDPYTRNNYSILGGAQHYDACDGKSPNEAYADWTKVTLSFTALDDDTNIGPQVVAFSFSLPKAANADNPLKFDIKDVKFIEKFTEVSDDEEENPSFTIPDLVGKYKTQGRTSVINDILMVDYSASGIEFSANCEGDVSLSFNATKLKDGDEGGCYFTVIVDGVKKARDFCHITATGDTTVTIAENLVFGTHTFEIYRQTEIERATIGIKSINLSGEFLPAPQYNDMYIEIIGDSAVTAYGNLAENGVVSKESAPLPKYQDVTQGYAYLTARELGADWSIVAQQGRGAKYGFSEENLQDIYPKLRYNKDKTTDYDFAREPDYVIAALGTNDLYTYNKADYTDPVATLADVKAGYKEMLTLLREKNPNSIIIWAGIDYESELEILAKEVVAEAGGELKGYYSVKLTADKLGGNSHPSAASHIIMAEELSAFIKEVDKQNDFATGDINDDGAFNLNDLIELAQHTAAWENLNIKTLAADVDGNKMVNLNDVTCLAQYLAGWDTQLGGDMMDYTCGLTGVVNKRVTNYVSSDGLKMPYTLLVPKNYNKNKEYPVVMFFHGADAKGTCNEKPIQKLEPFYDTDAKTMSEAIVLIPQCLNKEDATTMGPYTKPGWWRYKDDSKGTLDVAMELLENEVLAKYNCDSNRFYVMGLSMGGEATWKTLEKHPEKIAAAVAICGSNRGDNLSAGDSTDFEDATKIKDVPIWIYHGTEDQDVLVSVSEQRYDNLIAAGAENVTFTVLEGYPHNVWSYAAADGEMIEWLFNQKLN